MLFIGVHIGTSSTRLLLMDEEGKVRNLVRREYGTQYPEAGWSEQNPEDWWHAVVSGIPELLQGEKREEVAGIGVAGQMHGLVVLDKQDRVIRPAMLWNDGRAQVQTDYLNNEVGREMLSKNTGNVAFAGFTAPHLLWLREEEPRNFQLIDKVMVPKDYIVYLLCGEHSTDVSDASGTLLFNVPQRCWSKPMMNLCGLRERQLPKVHESWEVVGTLRQEVARVLGLPETVKVVAGAGNVAAAQVGSDALNHGRCNISIGTSGTICVATDGFVLPSGNALHSFCDASGRWQLMGCVLSAAACTRWWTQGILDTNNYAVEQGMVDEDQLGHNDVFFLPYLMGERSPYNDPKARGAFIGMHADTSRADMNQAVLEGVAFALRDCLDIARSEEIAVKGATISRAEVSPLWGKILAGVLGIPLYAPHVEETTAFGAAILATVGAGVFADVRTAASQLVSVDELEVPTRWTISLYQERYEAWHQLYPALRPLFGRMRG